MMKSPEDVYQNLLEEASTRMKPKLELINDICKEQIERGSTDFKIATIARISEAKNGIKAQTIRNKTGKAYQDLINAYANAHQSTVSKPKLKSEHDWVDEIKDPRIRWLVLDLITKNKELNSQLIKFKRVTELEIDMRKQSDALSGGIDLKGSDIDALNHAIEPKTLSDLGCYMDEKGYVINEATGRKAYKPAYISAIQKVLTVS